jgi:hypothetical protein
MNSRFSQQGTTQQMIDAGLRRASMYRTSVICPVRVALGAAAASRSRTS